VLAQPGGVAWNVFDGEILKLARTFPDFCDAEATGALKTCADLTELATLIGCGAINSGAACAYIHWPESTFDTQNEAFSASKGYSDARIFKRQLSAPFYAIKVTGALFHTQGGLDIDAQCRVLYEDGKPLPNLLAAGGAARGVSGNAVWGYLSGNGLLSAVAGGAIAAKTITALLKEKA
jgi:fumarate reductase flavoprotein subunit